MTDTLFSNVGVVTVDDAGTIVENGWIAVEDGHIAAYGEGQAPAALVAGAREHLNADGHVVMPGMVNAHTHLFQTFFRGLADDLALLDWLEQCIWPGAGHMDAAAAQAAAAVGLIENLRSGVTTVIDHQYIHPGADADSIDEAVASAAHDLGIRLVLAHGWADRNYHPPLTSDAGTVERRLTALYLLSHADIRGTSPKVWNGWKARLLEDLFHATRRLLRGASPEEALGLEDRRTDAQRLLRYHGLRPDVEKALWNTLDSVYFMRHSAEEIAWHARHLYHRPESVAPVVRARLSEGGEGIQVMVFARDQKDLFMRLCGFFGRLGYSILDAKIHTTRHGYALDSFMVQYPGEDTHYREHIALIEHELPKLLESEAQTDRPPEPRLSRHVKHFPVRPAVRLRADESGKQYILTLTAADRPGLLYDVAKTLASFNVQLHTAKIATLGERVEDAFLVTGRGLSSDSHVLQIERELLKELQI